MNHGPYVKLSDEIIQNGRGHIAALRLSLSNEFPPWPETQDEIDALIVPPTTNDRYEQRADLR